MGKSSPSPPPAPDPAATAAAQGAANKDAAIAAATINMVDQSTPYGNLTYKNLDPVNGVPRYEAIVTLSPEQQQLLAQQTQGQTALNQLGLAQLGRIEDSVSQPFSYDSMPALTGSIGANLPGLQTSVGSVPGIQSSLDFSGLNPVQSGFDRGGNIQSSLDFGSAPELMNTTALDAERSRIENALFQRINPQIEQDRASLEQRLANQGITLGSQAYNSAMDDYNRGVNDLRLGIIGSGGDELSRLYGISLSGRQQGVSELLNQGQFANTAQQQAFGQNQALADFNNQARLQQAAELESQGQFANTAQQQAYGQALSDANLSNSTRAQALNEQLSMGQFGNTARQQAIQEQAYARDRPLAELSSFMSGGQPLMPQFTNTPQSQVQAADIVGPTYANYQGQLSNYNAQLGGRNSQMGALAGLGGSALGGWAMGGFANPFGG